MVSRSSHPRQIKQNTSFDVCLEFKVRPSPSRLPTSHNLSNIFITAQEVSRLRTLDPKNATGPSKIPVVVLTILTQSYLQSFLKLFDCFLKEKFFPSLREVEVHARFLRMWVNTHSPHIIDPPVSSVLSVNSLKL